MEKTEERLSPEESLRLIESMINRVKDRFGEDGYLFLFWGWLVFFCGITEFVLSHFMHYAKHYWVWSLCWAALVYQVYYIRKKHRTLKVHTYTGHILGYVWITYLILSFLIGFLIGRLTGNNYFYHIFPIVLSLYGMPLFLSGIILRFRPLVYGAVCSWILSVIATFLSFDYQMLMLPVAMMTGWIIPGYLLRAKSKLQ